LVIDAQADAVVRATAASSSDIGDTSPVLIAKGLRITLPILEVFEGIFFAYLYCKHREKGQLLCLLLRPISLQPPRFEIGIAKARQNRFLPAETTSSFHLVTLVILQQKRRNGVNILDEAPGMYRYKVPKSLGSVHCLEFEIEARNSIQGSLYKSWGPSRIDLPWKANILQSCTPDSSGYVQNKYGIGFIAALIVLDSVDNFWVTFGITWNGQLWCKINPVPQVRGSTDQQLELSFDFKRRKMRKEGPMVPIDRAALSLESMYLYSVSVSASFRAKGGGRLVMRVLIERISSSTLTRPPPKTIRERLHSWWARITIEN
jgi:hypothetical protein